MLDDVTHAQPAGVPLPVSLVVPVRDEAATLPTLIADLTAQSRQPAEVVLVDGGSADGTPELLHAQARRDPRWVVVEADGGATPGRGRNLGVAAAREDWIAMTDAGVRVDPAWLERLWAAHLAAPDALVVYGSFDFDTRSFFEECAAIAYGTAKRETRWGRVRRPAVVSCLVHRNAFERVGGFPDLRAGEDMIFVQRVEELGLPVTWAPDATVWWRLRPDARSTFERFRLYSYHNALAGQQPHWHHRLARSYVPVAAGLLAGAVGGRRWLGLAAAPVGARVAVRLRRHQEGRGWAWLLRPDRVGLVAGLLVMNDAATALGWWQASRTTRRGGSGDAGGPAPEPRPAG